jgi:hypothetical protein
MMTVVNTREKQIAPTNSATLEQMHACDPSNSFLSYLGFQQTISMIAVFLVGGIAYLVPSVP